MNLCREKTGREDASQHATTKKCLSATPRARKTAGQQREDPRRLECHFALFRNRPHQAGAGDVGVGDRHGSVRNKRAVLFDAIWPHNDPDTIVGNSPKQTPFHLFLDTALKTPHFAPKLPGG